MADCGRACLRVLSMVVLAGLAAACVARPTGDFGRATPGLLHDTAMPMAGNMLASARKEPVSRFNVTDQEEEMHDRVWRFLVAPHAKDWLFDSAVELQRTRIIPPKDESYRTDRYYRWLKSTQYQSSRTRYSTVGSHATIDIETLPTTFAAICAVIAVDQQRAAALGTLAPQLPPTAGEDVTARKAENNAYIAWFVRALNYRYQSYDFALDSLLVETPHEQSIAVDETLRRLDVFVGRANRHDFCGNGGQMAGQSDFVIPSRFQHKGDTEIVLQK
ncbi:MAG: hypothetical protein KKF33_03715 [Alphaproteobacteria bacterium]|nr:hypothetical protein [Alphaproteobacteria bacterium]